MSDQNLRESEPLITVRMSASAADALAKACAWAEQRAWDESQDVERGDPSRQRAGEAYTWLSWGHHWLLNPEARAVLEGPPNA